MYLLLFYNQISKALKNSIFVDNKILDNMVNVDNINIDLNIILLIFHNFLIIYSKFL